MPTLTPRSVLTGTPPADGRLHHCADPALPARALHAQLRDTPCPPQVRTRSTSTPPIARLTRTARSTTAAWRSRRRGSKPSMRRRGRRRVLQQRAAARHRRRGRQGGGRRGVRATSTKPRSSSRRSTRRLRGTPSARPRRARRRARIVRASRRRRASSCEPGPERGSAARARRMPTTGLSKIGSDASRTRSARPS